jgi:hypothetical protein
VARGNLWTRLQAVAARLPTAGVGVVGIIRTIIDPGYPDKIGGIHYTACGGHEHPLDGQSIDFGVPGLDRDRVPSPWRELLNGAKDEPFTFNLDSPEQDIRAASRGDSVLSKST